MLTFQIEMYKLDEDGELKSTNFDRTELKSEDVLLIADENTKTLWIWKGTAINVRKKFLSARAAVQLNNQKGRIFKSNSIEEGNEPEDFLSLFNNTEVRKTTSKKRSTSVTKETKKSKSDTIPIPTESATSLVEETIPPQKTPPASTSFIQENKEKSYEITLKLEEITALFGAPPKGFERDYVIIGSTVYGVVVSTSNFLGTKTTDTHYQKLEGIKDGHFVAEGYIPRVLVKDKKVKAIEFIKKRETEKNADVTKELKAIKEEVLSDDLTESKDEEPLIVYINPLFK
ncbi:MAG: hypothetical protein ACFFCD_10755 [Promethearchaeota archaeon]